MADQLRLACGKRAASLLIVLTIVATQAALRLKSIPNEVEHPPIAEPTAYKQNNDEDAHSDQHPDTVIAGEFIEEFSPQHGPTMASAGCHEPSV